MFCETCGHENTKAKTLDKTTDVSGRHRANMCERCNCGESEIIHRDMPPSMYSPFDYANDILTWGNKMSYKMRPQTRFTH